MSMEKSKQRKILAYSCGLLGRRWCEWAREGEEGAKKNRNNHAQESKVYYNFILCLCKIMFIGLEEK